MTTARVHQFPEKLERLVVKIKADLQRREKTTTEWVDATLDLCADLAETRAEFVDNISFGAWFEASGIELNKDERAAAIAMGGDLARAREVLSTTKRRSLQLICAKEFRLLSTQKTRTSASQPSKPLQKVLDELDRRAAAGEDISYTALKEATGVGASTVSKATAMRAVVSSPLPPPAPPAPPPALLPELSLTAQQKLDAWQKKLEADFDRRVQKAANEWLAEHHIPLYEKKFKEIERLLDRPHLSIMTREEYNTIVKCLHPDGLLSRNKEDLGQAFRVFTKYKLRLISPDQEWRRSAMRGVPLPKTVAEMLARKRRRG